MTSSTSPATTSQRTPGRPPGRPLVTVALLGTGSLLAATGLTMLIAGLTKSAALYKAWSLLGVTPKGVGTLHQIAAVGFLTSAGVHITRNRRIIKRHFESFDEKEKEPNPPLSSQSAAST